VKGLGVLGKCDHSVHQKGGSSMFWSRSVGVPRGAGVCGREKGEARQGWSKLMVLLWCFYIFGREKASVWGVGFAPFRLGGGVEGVGGGPAPNSR